MTDGMSTGQTDSRRQDLVQLARRTWRRLGVRRRDLQAMLVELDAELAAAQADSLPLEIVLGGQPALALKEWADERGVSGRSLRLGLTIPIGLLGATAGFALTLTFLIQALAQPSTCVADSIDRSVTICSPGAPMTTSVVLLTYGSSGLLALLLCTAGVWAALRIFGDPGAERTARVLVKVLPIGGVLALLAGVGTASLFDFRRPAISFPTVVLVVLVVLAGTITMARHRSTR